MMSYGVTPVGTNKTVLPRRNTNDEWNDNDVWTDGCIQYGAAKKKKLFRMGHEEHGCEQPAKKEKQQRR